jgi:ligand-binding sensor domain-containing protein
MKSKGKCTRFYIFTCNSNPYFTEFKLQIISNMKHPIRHLFLPATLMLTTIIGLGAIHGSDKQADNAMQMHGKALYQSQDTIGQSISADIGTAVKRFTAIAVDDNNRKWFLTEQGIVSFDNTKWTLHSKNRKVGIQDLKDFAFEANPHGQELWIASPKGATVASLPIDARTGATTYHVENSSILSNNVLQVAIGKSPMRWFGTDKGISAFKNDLWLTPEYLELYYEEQFLEFPITSMATNANGDTLYVGTDGAGVARVFRNDVDGISGASPYAQWGPIIIPSDKIYSVFIASDNTQWFGTDMGLARHTGNNTLENWTVFTTSDGLPDNFVQVIAADNLGNIWIGTRKGASMFDGSIWFSTSKEDGLNSDNVLSIAVDKKGIVWIGTDDGVTSYNLGVLTNYR